MSATASTTKTELRTPKNSFFKRALFGRLEKLSCGQLTINDGDRSYVFSGAESGPVATIDVVDGRVFREVCLGGSIGAAEAFMEGYWETDDLLEVVRIFVANREMLEHLEAGLARTTLPLLKGYHWLTRNTVRGSKKNIAAHYDLGNEFFALFLDPTMMYSSAVFPSQSSSLETASTHKLDLICRKLKLKPEHHIIEIGTGWGGFAIHAAKNYGCHVTTTTISKRQFEYATERVKAEGLDDRVTVLDKDYRDLHGQFDRVVSIEMIEAVGHDFFDSYFKKVGTLLKPTGAALIQAILMAENNYEKAAQNVDFIKRYIFPGGCLPSTGAIMNSIAKTTDCWLVDLHDIGLDYSRTLASWRESFTEQLSEVRAQGFSDQFIRMWDYYFCYCEGAFSERAISAAQLLFQRPGCTEVALQERG